MPNVFSSILKGSSEHKKVGGDFEFDLWQPVASLGKNEAVGLASAAGHLEPLASKHILPMLPIENYFGDLFSRVWKKATPTAGAPRGNFLAQTRAPSPSSKPAQSYQPQVSPTAPPTGDAHLKSIANDWKMIEGLERICAYTWRGDGRDPAALKAAGGFQPPSARNDDGYIKGAVYKQFCSYLERRAGRDIASTVSADDFLTIVRQTLTSPEAKSLFVDYCIWRSLVKSEELHLGRMLANEALKGYVSTTKSVSVAKAFACMRDSSAGWVYLVLIKGGFAVPDKGKHAWTAIFGEQEIAMPGAVSWAHVYGYRHVSKGRFNPASPIALRKGLKEDEPTVFKEAYDLLSGKTQG